MSELLPCPFCGSVNGPRALDSAELGFNTGNYAVVCCILNDGCGATGGYKETEQKAIENWNSRGYVEDIVSKLKAAEVPSHIISSDVLTISDATSIVRKAFGIETGDDN